MTKTKTMAGGGGWWVAPEPGRDLHISTIVRHVGFFISESINCINIYLDMCIYIYIFIYFYFSLLYRSYFDFIYIYIYRHIFAYIYI